MSDFLQRATSATSNERILQRVTSDFTTSNEQRVNFNEQRETSEKLRLATNEARKNYLASKQNIKQIKHNFFFSENSLNMEMKKYHTHKY